MGFSCDTSKMLERGGFATVFKGTYRSDQLIPVAVKQVQLLDVMNQSKEEEALKLLNHPSVIKCYQTANDFNFRY